MSETAIDLKTAYRAAFHLVDAYVALEQQPDEGLVLLREYLRSDPARWDDWMDAVVAAQLGQGVDP